MQDTLITPGLKPELKVERPRLHKVILVNDDFTPARFCDKSAERASFACPNPAPCP